MALGKKCQRCESDRIASVCGKAGGGTCSTEVGSREDISGDVRDDMGIGGRYGDYIEFDWCLDCGQIQGKWPLPKTELEEG